MKRRNIEDMEKVKMEERNLRDMFLKSPTSEFFEFAEKHDEMIKDKEEFKKIISEKIKKGDYSFNGSLEEEYINLRVESFFKIKSLKFHNDMLNKALRELKGNLSRYQTTLHYILLGRNPELTKEVFRLKEKNDKLRKENNALRRTMGLIKDKEVLKKIHQSLEDIKQGNYIELRDLNTKERGGKK